ncbi:MAG: hypothetical protein ACFCUM_10270 [Bacteroidales bacterium]
MGAIVTRETNFEQNFRLWYDPGNIYYYSDMALDPVDDAATVNGIVTSLLIRRNQGRTGGSYIKLKPL